MKYEIDYTLHPIGFVESSIVNREEAPSQGHEGAPDVWITFNKNISEGLADIRVSEEIIILTWFHQAKRDVLKLHPRWDKKNPLTGVFSTRSPDRPNPIGLHQVRVLQIKDNSIKVAALEAIDGTPVLDIKPVLN